MSFIALGGHFFSLAFAAANATPTPEQLASAGGSEGLATNPLTLLLILGGLSLAPFGLIMLTSFVKLSVVFSLLRSALGTQQAPPNQVITGLSLVLTIFIMAPVVEKMREAAGPVGNTKALFSQESLVTLLEAGKRGREPLRLFLKRQTQDAELAMFYELSQYLAKANGNDPKEIDPDGFRVLVPAFVTSELSEAFKIGFFLFLPFLVIDMIVSNVLQAMGMFMLSPMSISLPFKLLLFVLADGWHKLAQALVLDYTR
jgi:type III secretion protein R